MLLKSNSIIIILLQVGQTVFCEAFISSKNVDRLAYMVNINQYLKLFDENLISNKSCVTYIYTFITDNSTWTDRVPKRHCPEIGYHQNHHIPGNILDVSVFTTCCLLHNKQWRCRL